MLTIRCHRIIILATTVGICLLLTGFTTKNELTILNEVTMNNNLNSSKAQLASAVTNKRWNEAANYAKKLAVYYDKHKQYDDAIHYYEQAAEYWAQAGHPSWGIINLIRADHIRTHAELYIEQIDLARDDSQAKFEPAWGTYLGMFPAEKRASGRPGAIQPIYDKPHALFLTYTSWRQKYQDTNSYFPIRYATEAKRAGGAIQIGWEPMGGLNDVMDDEYVRQFAREARAMDMPIFLRYASEMNGPWVPWHGDPAQYIKKFRLIHDIMAEEAPNVAMVWSPNFLPRDNISPYYPGDDYVDWVGFSLYTIPYSHGEEKPGGNPIDYLRPLYAAYAHKPIMISEGAVSFYSYELQKDYTDWAVGQLGNMYGYLPRLFPQVKAITYFNLDKKTTNYDNKNNNYDLGDNPAMDKRYNELIDSEQFLSTVKEDFPLTMKKVYVPFETVSGLRGKQKVFAYVKLPLGQQPHYVALYHGADKLGESYRLPWDMTIDVSHIPAEAKLTLIAFDRSYKRLLTKQIQLK